MENIWKVMIENEGVDLAIVAYNYKFIEENKETQLFIKKNKINNISSWIIYGLWHGKNALDILNIIKAELGGVLNVKKIRKKILLYKN